MSSDSEYSSEDMLMDVQHEIARARGVLPLLKYDV